MDVILNTDCACVPEGAVLSSLSGDLPLNLLISLGYDPLNPPVGDLLRTVHHLDGEWLVLSPIRWEASHNDALIVAIGKELNLGEDESRASFKPLADFLAEEGIVLYYHDENTWLMSVTGLPALNAKPVYSILNHSLMPELGQLDATMYWQKFFTECQMFFASQSKQSVLNGVWPWGGGTLAAKKETLIIADNSLTTLAQCCSTQVITYNATINLQKNSILLLQDIENLSPQHQDEIKNVSSCWFWNNTRYNTTKLNWFTRIWRNLTHAH